MGLNLLTIVANVDTSMSPNVVHVYALVLVMLRVVLHSSQSAFDKFCDKKIGFFRMKETHFIVLLKSFFAVKLGAEIIQQRQQLLQQQLQNQQLQSHLLRERQLLQPLQQLLQSQLRQQLQRFQLCCRKRSLKDLR